MKRKEENRHAAAFVGKALGFTAILAALLLLLNHIFVLRNNEQVIPDFYTSLPEYDAVITGSSVAMYGIWPMELWEEKGITAYNLASANQSIPSSYYLVKEAIETKHPKLVIFDVGQAYLESAIYDEAQLHNASDHLNLLSRNRIRMIHDLAPHEFRSQYYFPLAIYHQHWKELFSENDTDLYKNLTYGAKISYHVKSAKQYKEVENDPGYYLPEVTEEYLRKTIGLCRDTGTQLLFVGTPFIGKHSGVSQKEYEMRVRSVRAACALGEENGAACLNLIDDADEVGLDYRHDTTDGKHLNYRGAKKYTDYLAGYLGETFGIGHDASADSDAKMRKDFETYAEYAWKNSIVSPYLISSYVESLREDPRKESEIILLAGRKLSQVGFDKTRADYLRQLGLQTDFSEFKGAYVAAIEGGQVVYETGQGGVPGSDSESYETELYRVESTGKTADILLNGVPQCSKKVGLHVLVYNRETGEIIDKSTIGALRNGGYRVRHERAA